MKKFMEKIKYIFTDTTGWVVPYDLLEVYYGTPKTIKELLYFDEKIRYKESYAVTLHCHNCKWQSIIDGSLKDIGIPMDKEPSDLKCPICRKKKLFSGSYWLNDCGYCKKGE